MKNDNQLDNDMLATSITHPRNIAVKCWDVLLEKCSSLSCFASRIEKQAGIIEKSEKVDFFDKYGEDGANSFKGDVTEVFAEYVLKGYGRTWGIYNYVPFFSVCGEDQDVGVDGTGKTKDGRVITVQVKYGNWSTALDHIKRKLRTFHWTSISKYGVGTTSRDQMFVFTLAHDINWMTLGGHFHGRLKFIAQEESGGIYLPNNDPTEVCSLKSVCGNNPTFWKTFCEMVKS
ncbi:MAG: hypothetical protein WC119_00490 [Synergistaceae bacterium]